MTLLIHSSIPLLFRVREQTGKSAGAGRQPRYPLTHTHTQWLLLAVSTSSPGVSHTHTRFLFQEEASAAAFFPYMAKELFKVEVCADSNQGLIQQSLLDLMLILAQAGLFA